jgi:pimeloyl-ACP methyl ester carboxylesterase
MRAVDSRQITRLDRPRHGRLRRACRSVVEGYRTLMATVECNKATLFYEERGSGPPILLITGTGGHAGAVAALAERLATDHRTISYDRRGYGRTPAPASRPRGYLAEHVADAAALLRSLAAPHAIVFGWSWGGIIALGLAIEHPDLVARLVLYEPPLHVKKHMTLAAASAIGGAILLGKLGMRSRGAVHFARRTLARTDKRNSFFELDAATRESLLASSNTMLAELEAGSGEELELDAIGRIRCPTAVILGDRSVPFLQQASQRVADALASPRVVRMPDGDHMMPVTDPDRLAGVIHECIADASSVGASTPGR